MALQEIVYICLIDDVGVIPLFSLHGSGNWSNNQNGETQGNLCPHLLLHP